MPVPTDTYWNISRLNKVFAVSALLLLAVMGWSVLQDYDKQWREPQKSGKAWEAALVSEKLVDRAGVEADAAKLDKEIADIGADIASKEPRYKELNDQIAAIMAKQANLDFKTNTLKAVVGEQQKYLELAKTDNDAARVKELNEKIDPKQAQLSGYIEQQGQYKAELKEAKDELAKVTVDLDKIKKDRVKKTEDRDALKKKLNALAPDSFVGRTMTQIRQIPLLQFVNPAERVKQQVLPDVLTDLGGFKTVSAIDRCVTCHVNIDKKDFAEEKVLSYLEEQLATSRHLKLAVEFSGKAGDPLATQLHPGATAMPEFWLKYTAIVSPDLMKKPAIANRIKSLSATVGKSAIVTIDGKPLAAFTFAPDESKKDDAPSVALGDASRQAVIAQVIDAWIRFSKDADTTSTSGSVTVKISKDLEDKATTAPHKAALLVAEDLKNSLTTALQPEPRKLKLVLDRYRRSMIAEVNVARKAGGLTPLDPSPVMLAHPKLDLYAETDSKHPMEKVGCTSCHDGSGQETRFILAAHTPEPIWVDDSTGEPVLPQQLKLAKPPEAEKPMLDNMLKAVYPESMIAPINAESMHLAIGEAKSEGPTTKPAAIVEVPDEAPAHADPVAYLDPITGKTGKAVSQLMYWKGKYESESGQTYETTEEEWDFPMRPPQYIQANCVRCHTSVNDIKETAPVLYEGRHLFNTLGCVNCHQMDSIPTNEQRRVGPDLRHLSAKLSPAMIDTWIWAPKAFRPTTKMPHFFMLENNSSDEELRRTRQEARSITEYLLQTAEPLPPKHIAPTDLTGKVEDGRKVFNTIGCLGCHQNLSDPAGDAKRAGKVITRGEQWIVQDLVLGGELAKKLTLETGKAPAAADLTAEANKLYDAMSYNERQLYVLEHLDADKNKTGQDTYDDAKHTVKPVFMHHGPELSGVGTKLLADRTPEQAKAWLFDWVKEPRHYSDYTVMPQLRLTDQQAIDLVAYLLDQKRTNTVPDDVWKASLTEVDSAKLIELTSLFLRARYSPNTATARADDPTELRALATDALTTANTPADAAKAKVAALEASPYGKDELRMVFLGKKLITNYGCMQCHAINGMEQASSPCANLSDWGQKLVSKLDFGYVDPHKSEYLPAQKMMMVNGLSPHAADMTQPMTGADWQQPIAAPVTAAWPEVEHSRESWITHKLMNTRVWDRGKALLDPVRAYDKQTGKLLTTEDGHPLIADSGKPYDKVKMPTFYLSDDDITAITTFVISNRDRLISDKLTAQVTSPNAQQIAHGRYLVTEKYNCTTCHITEKNKPQVQQYYDPSKLTVDAPPSLRGEGNKVQFAWLFNFFKNVQSLRPVLVNGIHMPSFPATDQEWTDILTYFSDVSNKEAKELKAHVDPVMKYIATAKQAAAVASTDDTALADSVGAGDDWYLQPILQGSVTYLRQWGLDYKQITDIEIDPLKNAPADLAAGYKKLLYRARFTQDLYAASFPFVDTPHPEVSKERFARGEAFFKELQCLSCHYLGQPAPGAVPKAPNLNLAHVRLRRDWAQHWVREPSVIQLGTSMPQFFSGMKVDDIHGQTSARASELPPEVIARTEAAYGETAQEQIDLLFDFIYTAGETGYTVVPLASGEEAPSVRMEKNGEIKVKPIPAPTTKPAVKTAAPKVPTAGAAPVAPAPVANAGVTGTVAGKIVLSGTPPKPDDLPVSTVAECGAMHPDGLADEGEVASAKGELKNVIVSVSSGLNGPFAIPTEPAVLTQKGCQYFPHVLAMMVGQKLIIKNDDTLLHNVHTLSNINPPVNFGQMHDPGKDVGAFKAVENFRVKCDVHPWMNMNISVFDNPYFAVSGDDGSFTLPPLPPGTYTLTFWHEKLGTQEKEITVEAGKKVDVNITFNQ